MLVFTQTLTGMQGIVRFVPIWEKYVYEFFRSCIDDGIMYTEARISFLQKYVVSTTCLLVLIFLLSSVIRTMKDEHGEDTITHDKWIEVFDNMLHRIKEELGSEGNANQFFSAKVMISTVLFSIL